MAVSQAIVGESKGNRSYCGRNEPAADRRTWHKNKKSARRKQALQISRKHYLPIATLSMKRVPASNLISLFAEEVTTPSFSVMFL